MAACTTVIQYSTAKRYQESNFLDTIFAINVYIKLDYTFTAAPNYYANINRFCNVFSVFVRKTKEIEVCSNVNNGFVEFDGLSKYGHSSHY